LHFGCWLYGLPKAHIRQVLEQMGLMDRAKDPLLQPDEPAVDILVGKPPAVLVFQLAMTIVVLVILKSITGSISLVLLFVVLGACFSLSTGLLFGSMFNTVQAASTVAGIIAFICILSSIFVGQVGEVLGDGLVARLVRFIPTYSIADGSINAPQNAGMLGSNLLDAGISLRATLILLAVSAWALRRFVAVSHRLRPVYACVVAHRRNRYEVPSATKHPKYLQLVISQLYIRLFHVKPLYQLRRLSIRSSIVSRETSFVLYKCVKRIIMYVILHDPMELSNRLTICAGSVLPAQLVTPFSRPQTSNKSSTWSR
jgi:hypothetical protein